ncbi:MAG: helix-turn-helix domain-containing protein [Candidatus Saccharibacteria bacterium]
MPAVPSKPQRSLNAILAEVLDELAENILQDNLKYAAHRLHAAAKEIRTIPETLGNEKDRFQVELVETPLGIEKTDGKIRAKQFRGLLNIDDFNQVILIVIGTLGDKTTLSRVKKLDRDRQTVRARQSTMWVLRKTYEMSYPIIAEYFGLDHTTVIHALKSIDKNRATDPMLQLSLASALTQTLELVPNRKENQPPA